MPSFDVVSEVDEHELANAIDQANREFEKLLNQRAVDEYHARERYELRMKQMDQAMAAKHHESMAEK